jgi:hypothetical protein
MARLKGTRLARSYASGAMTMITKKRLLDCVSPFVLFLVCACNGSGSSPQLPGPVPTGPHYEGVVRTEWNPDGRTMTLLEDFSFVDAANLKWTAKKGSKVDGASIPQVLWSAGGPYEGKYRDASVIHDVYCDETPKSKTWRAVHRVFYDGMLVSGVDPSRALFMYGAVFRHGPRWPDPGTRNEAGPARPPDQDEDLRKLEAMVNSGEVRTVEEVEKLPPVLPPK